MSAAEEFARLRRISHAAELWDEGGQPLVFLPDLKLQHGKAAETVDALLVPRAHSGYTTRLFFSRPFPDRGQNWTVHSIMGRAWHAMSFNEVPASLPWNAILASHLRPLK